VIISSEPLQSRTSKNGQKVPFVGLSQYFPYIHIGNIENLLNFFLPSLEFVILHMADLTSFEHKQATYLMHSGLLDTWSWNINGHHRTLEVGVIDCQEPARPFS